MRDPARRRAIRSREGAVEAHVKKVTKVAEAPDHKLAATTKLFQEMEEKLATQQSEATARLVKIQEAKKCKTSRKTKAESGLVVEASGWPLGLAASRWFNAWLGLLPARRLGYWHVASALTSHEWPSRALEKLKLLKINKHLFKYLL